MSWTSGASPCRDLERTLRARERGAPEDVRAQVRLEERRGQVGPELARERDWAVHVALDQGEHDEAQRRHDQHRQEQQPQPPQQVGEERGRHGGPGYPRPR